MLISLVINELDLPPAFVILTEFNPFGEEHYVYEQSVPNPFFKNSLYNDDEMQFSVKLN